MGGEKMLDDLDRLKALDRSGMLDTVGALPDQLRHAAALSQGVEFPTIVILSQTTSASRALSALPYWSTLQSVITFSITVGAGSAPPKKQKRIPPPSVTA